MITKEDTKKKFMELKSSHPNWHASIESIFEEVVAIRRNLHEHPELAFEETRTSGIVAELLEKWGYEVKRNVGRTGVIGLLHGTSQGPVIGLRADMDALPMPDKINQLYKSKHEGIAHTCGHDAHTAILLGVAKVFADKGLESGSLKLIFQPAEEIGQGADAMIKDGALENPQVDVMAGLHVHPTLKTGEFSVTDTEYSCAAVDIFELTITGTGGHAAHPHQTIDPIIIAAQVLIALQQVVSRQTNPLDSVVLSFGQIEGGTKATIIPDSVLLKGTVRTLNPEIRTQMPEKIKTIAQGIARSFRGDASLTYNRITPSIKIDENMRGLLTETVSELFGGEALRITSPSMGGEDFAYFSQKVPSVFFRLGTRGGESTAFPNHNSRFDVDEQAFLYGISALSLLTYKFLQTKKGGK